MTERTVTFPSAAEQRAAGTEARTLVPVSTHAGWTPAADRPDPVALLEEQNPTREPDLVPVRHGRMMVSPFTFYRGAAKIMAADLAGTPTAGLARAAVRGRAPVQLRGVRLPGAATGVRPQRLRRDPARAVRVRRETDGGQLHHRRPEQRPHQGRRTGRRRPRRCGPTGRRWPRFARMRTMDLWYAHLSEDDLRAAIAQTRHRGHRASKARQEGKDSRRRRPKDGARPTEGDRKPARRRRQAEKTCRKAHTRDSLQALSKLGELVDGHYRIVSQPPVVIPARDLAATYGDVTAGRGREASCTTSSGSTGPPCRTTGGTCWNGSRSSTWPARSSASAASAPGRSSCCCRAATSRTRCSCRSRRPTRSVLEDHLPQEPLPQPRGTGRAGAADDAGRQRHLPRLDQGRPGRPATSTGGNCGT